MSIKIIFLEEFGKAFIPERAIPYIRRYLFKAGILKVPYKFFGALFYLSVAITGFVYIFYIYPMFQSYLHFKFFLLAFLSWFLLQSSLALLFILLIYFYLDMRIFNRTKELEKALPDFLQAVSSNLKSGQTFEESLWNSINPKFSILANEIAEVSKKVMTGEDVDVALIEFSEKYNSPMLRRAVDLIIGEVKSGANIADILDKIIRNIKETRVLKDEMSASAVAYIIFISAIVIFIAPLLFALSFNLLVLVDGFSSKIVVATQKTSSLPFNISEIKINFDHFRIFTMSAVAIISIFSSMIVSIVEKGNIKGGLKYVPLYLFGSLGFYLIFLKVLSYIFVGLV